uniref:30S ribosomal protein S14 n=1 Tax=Palpitomonas bilix TaxID=652834 RepID=A0A1E1GHS3_9EUKA|nr:30S ribosomal protein S14 [Palpitomonas bilix]BAV82416.1 30S ribosomal protein S14 [Palpitomonas bilix]
MKSFIQRDIKKRLLHLKYEKKRLVLKTLIKNKQLTPKLRLFASFQLNKLPKNSSLVRIHNRCIITGRTRGIYRRFKISRIQLRDLIGQGLIPGLVKSSW